MFSNGFSEKYLLLCRIEAQHDKKRKYLFIQTYKTSVVLDNAEKK